MKKKFITIFLFCLVVFGVFTVSANAVSTVASGSCGANGDNVTWTLDDAGVLTISGTGAMADYASYTALPWYNDRINIKTVTIKNGVTSVGDYAFYGCIFTSVTLPESMTEIGKWAFSHSKLSSLTLPAGLTTIGENALRNCGFASITIPGSVTSIGRYAFCGNKLAHVTIESGVKSIDESAFCDCTGLTDIMIPTSVTSIADYAFYECSALASITIPEGVTDIGVYAFYGCTALTDITIPKDLTSIGSYAFMNCSGLKSITIPENVTSIGSAAFNGCTGLTDVTIGRSVTSIGAQAFQNCTGLQSITIPASVTGIGNNAFYGCTKLSAITVAAGSSTYSSVGGVLFNQDKTKLLQYPAGKEEAIYAIPNGVTGIENYAFCGCAALRNITISENVTSIGSSAFDGCTALTGVYISDLAAWCGIQFKGLDSNPLYYAHKLYLNNKAVTSLTIPEGVTNIAGYAFCGCTGLTDVTIGSGVKSIGACAFRDCTGLTDITLGSGVTSIGNNAFQNCTGLQSITIPASVTSIDGRAFDSCTALTSITVDASNPSYANDEYGVLYNKNKTVLVRYPAGNTRASYAIKSGVTSIGDSAFYGCTGLTDITLPAGLTTIGENALRNCGFASITIPGSVTSIGRYAFLGNKLAHVTIESGVKSIDEHAFYGCTGLTDITIPESVTSIGAYAFYGCTGLTDVTIPEGVTSIGNYAFYRCSALGKASFEGDAPTTFGTRVFDSCANGFTICAPKDNATWTVDSAYNATAQTWNGYPVAFDVTGVSGGLSNPAAFDYLAKCARERGVYHNNGYYSWTFKTDTGRPCFLDEYYIDYWPSFDQVDIGYLSTSTEFDDVSLNVRVTIPHDGSAPYEGYFNQTYEYGYKYKRGYLNVYPADFDSDTVCAFKDYSGAASGEADSAKTFTEGLVQCLRTVERFLLYAQGYSITDLGFAALKTETSREETDPAGSSAVYNFLANYAKEHGTYSAVTEGWYTYEFKTSSFSSHTNSYTLSYSPSEKLISFDLYTVMKNMENSFTFSSLEIAPDLEAPYRGYFCTVDYGVTMGEGYLSVTPSAFTKETELSFDTFSGPLPINQSGYATSFVLGLAGALAYAQESIFQPNGYSVRDLGFTALKTDLSEEGNPTFRYLVNYVREHGEYITDSSGSHYAFRFKTASTGTTYTDYYEIDYAPQDNELTFAATSESKSTSGTSLYSSVTVPANLKAPYEGFFGYRYRGKVDSMGTLYVTPSTFTVSTTSTFYSFTGNLSNKSSCASSFTLQLYKCLAYAKEFLHSEGCHLADLGFTTVDDCASSAGGGESTGGGESALSGTIYGHGSGKAFRYVANFTRSNGTWKQDLGEYAYVFSYLTNYSVGIYYSPSKVTLTFTLLFGNEASSSYWEIVIPSTFAVPYTVGFLDSGRVSINAQGTARIDPAAFDEMSELEFSTFTGNPDLRAEYANLFATGIKLCIRLVNSNIMGPTYSVGDLGFTKIAEPKDESAGGSTVSFSGVTIPSGAAAYIALYGQNGQMLALQRAMPASGGAQAVIPASVYPEMKTAKLFVLRNGTLVPMGACGTVSK